MSQSKKRTIGDNETQEVFESPREGVSKSELDGILASFRADIRKDVTDLDASIGNKVESLVRALDSSSQSRFSAIEADLTDVNRRADKLGDEQAKMWQEIRQLRQGLAAAEVASSSHDIPPDQFDRDPDLTLLRINCDELCTKTSLLATITSWMEEASLSTEQWSLQGPEKTVAKSWTLRFNGAAGLAAKRVKKCMQLLRQPDGGWRQLSVTTPTDRIVRVYADYDRSPKQKLTEMGAKRLHRAMQAVHGDKTFHLLKREGAVCLDWKQVARVAPKPDRSFTLQWKNKLVTELGLNKERITEAFEASVSQPDAHWSP